MNSANSRLLRLGHRGARALTSIPENTLASFDRALADGCDGFEFDVRLTADGEAVVCHDPSLWKFRDFPRHGEAGRPPCPGCGMFCSVTAIRFSTLN